MEAVFTIASGYTTLIALPFRCFFGGVLGFILEDMVYHGPVLYLWGVTLLGSIGCTPGHGPGRRESATGRDAVALTCEAESQQLATGGVIIRDGAGKLALSSFRFLPLDGQAALGARQLVLCVARRLPPDMCRLRAAQ